jgi:hypothetical protein
VVNRSPSSNNAATQTLVLLVGLRNAFFSLSALSSWFPLLRAPNSRIAFFFIDRFLSHWLLTRDSLTLRCSYDTLFGFVSSICSPPILLSSPCYLSHYRRRVHRKTLNAPSSFQVNLPFHNAKVLHHHPYIDA